MEKRMSKVVISYLYIIYKENFYTSKAICICMTL